MKVQEVGLSWTVSSRWKPHDPRHGGRSGTRAIAALAALAGGDAPPAGRHRMPRRRSAAISTMSSPSSRRPSSSTERSSCIHLSNYATQSPAIVLIDAPESICPEARVGYHFSREDLDCAQSQRLRAGHLFFLRRRPAPSHLAQSKFPAPDLIVEVLSESTEANDRGIKFEDYAAHGVVEYWIVDPMAGDHRAVSPAGRRLPAGGQGEDRDHRQRGRDGLRDPRAGGLRWCGTARRVASDSGPCEAGTRVCPPCIKEPRASSLAVL